MEQSFSDKSLSMIYDVSLHQESTGAVKEITGKAFTKVGTGLGKFGSGLGKVAKGFVNIGEKGVVGAQSVVHKMHLGSGANRNAHNHDF